METHAAPLAPVEGGALSVDNASLEPPSPVEVAPVWDQRHFDADEWCLAQCAAARLSKGVQLRSLRLPSQVALLFGTGHCAETR